MSGVSFSIKKTEASKVVRAQSNDEKKVDYVLELEGREIKRWASIRSWTVGCGSIFHYLVPTHVTQLSTLSKLKYMFHTIKYIYSLT